MESDVAIAPRKPLTDAESVEHLAKARSMVRYYTAWSAGAGVVPIPVVDTVLVMGVQVQMLRKLAHHYGLAFNEELATKLVSVLLGGVLPSLVSGGVGSLFKMVPGVGTLLNVVTMPAFSAAATYAVGRVFTEHFDLGGTLLSFDPEKVRGYFNELYKSGAPAN